MLLAKFWHARYLTNGILWNVEQKSNYTRLRREKHHHHHHQQQQTNQQQLNISIWPNKVSTSMMSPLWKFENLFIRLISDWLSIKLFACCCCLFGFKVAFNIFSVISRRCLVASGSSMLTFIVLPHGSIMHQTLDMNPHPVTLSWHWVDQS